MADEHSFLWPGCVPGG